MNRSCGQLFRSKECVKSSRIISVKQFSISFPQENLPLNISGDLDLFEEIMSTNNVMILFLKNYMFQTH